MSALHAGLQRLVLSRNQLGADTALSLQRSACGALGKLVHLDLGSNCIGDAAAAALSHALLPSAACQLSLLDLSGNHSIGSEAARKISQALPYNTSLRCLNLGSACLGTRPAAGWPQCVCK